ncbi:hypothetical protein [Yersinia sp. 2542 StPb PI]|uniref:hypothetical protein n=1 Tax=Yersinia sp. 2542 StPb PI TaxID=3117408 RepID=UPI003B27E8C5
MPQVKRLLFAHTQQQRIIQPELLFNVHRFTLRQNIGRISFFDFPAGDTHRPACPNSSVWSY